MITLQGTIVNYINSAQQYDPKWNINKPRSVSMR